MPLHHREPLLRPQDMAYAVSQEGSRRDGVGGTQIGCRLAQQGQQALQPMLQISAVHLQQQGRQLLQVRACGKRDRTKGRHLQQSVKAGCSECIPAHTTRDSNAETASC